MAKKLYHFSAGDDVIFQRAREENDPTWVFNYYLRNPNSGTWWRPVPDYMIERLHLDESNRNRNSQQRRSQSSDTKQKLICIQRLFEIWFEEAKYLQLRLIIRIKASWSFLEKYQCPSVALSSGIALR